MVFGGDNDVLNARIFGRFDPRPRIELGGVKIPHKLLILSDGDVFGVHNPLADILGFLALVHPRRHGIGSPVDKQPESGIAPPAHAGVAGGLGFFGSGRLRPHAAQKQQGD